jgi:hypothetical protein
MSLTPALILRDDQPDSNLLNPACRECNQKSSNLIHVITHECLEGDALRCVIKAVPETAPLDPDDYMKVADLLKWLPGGDLAPTNSATAIASNNSPIETSTVAAPAPTTSEDATSIVVTIVPTSDAAPSVVTPAPTANAAPVNAGQTVVTIVATAGMHCLTISLCGV